MKIIELFEASVNDEPKYRSIGAEQAIRILNNKCMNALWMLDENRPFYRGTRNLQAEFMLVNTAATQRRSENTSNYYTVILDNHPDRKAFPKRSRSFIGSTSEYHARGYSNSSPYIMIPADSARIGCVNSVDMWDTRVSIFGLEKHIESLNRVWSQLGFKPDIKDFVEFDQKLRDGDEETVKLFKRVISTDGWHDNVNRGEDAYHDDGKAFLNAIWKAYSAESTGHKAYTTATFPHHVRDSEVWVGGEVMMISDEAWSRMQVHDGKWAIFDSLDSKWAAREKQE